MGGEGALHEMPHIVGKLDVGSRGVQFVAFPSRGLGGCGAVLGPGVDVPYAQYSPLAAVGQCPAQASVAVGVCGDVAHLALGEEGSGALPRVFLAGLPGHQRPASLSAPVVLVGGRQELDASHLDFMLVGEGELVVQGVRCFVAGQFQGHDVLPVAHGHLGA